MKTPPSGRGAAEPLAPIDAVHVLWRGASFLYFGGCDYLRLSRHATVRKAVKEGLARHGLSTAASRMTTGNHPLYEELEEALAAFFDVPAALLTSSGYLSNWIALQGLRHSQPRILMDARSHASLRDAAELGPSLSEFNHRDSEALYDALRGGAPALVLTDGVFGHDGSIAPVGEYAAVLEEESCLVIDDAHGAGVIGIRGRGTVEWAGLGRQGVVQTVTLSKAFGVYGGAVLGSWAAIDQIRRDSRAFAGSTPLPLPLAQGALASLALFPTLEARRQRLDNNTRWIKAALAAQGIPVSSGPAPIVSVVPKSRTEKERLLEALVAHEVFPSLIEGYPGGGTEPYFRFAISSEHTRRQLDCLASAIQFGVGC